MGLARIASFTSKNVFTNLAAEERLFERTSGHMLLFYINSPCIVLGRSQNPFHEADVSLATSERVPIARRRSGGGTVVHDAGNLNVCFIRPRAEHDACVNAKLLKGVLQDDFGIQVSLNSRGDILADGAKVSGSAYRITKDRAYHHATLLINSDLDRLRRLLQSPLRHRLDVTGTKSVPAHVANLTQFTSKGGIDIMSVMQAIANRWQGVVEADEPARIQSMSPSLVEREVGGIQGERGELCSHTWVYEKTPKFAFHGPPDDNVSVTLNVKRGAVINSVQLNGNGDYVADQERVNQLLVGRPFDRPSLSLALQDFSAGADRGVEQAVRRTIEDIPSQVWRDDASVNPTS